MCFDDPERDPDEQPNIAPDGIEHDHAGRLPRLGPRRAAAGDAAEAQRHRDAPEGDEGLRQPAQVPDPPQGAGRRRAEEREGHAQQQEPAGDARRRAADVLVDLRGLKRGRYTVKIVAVTYRGRTIQGSRRYRTCGKVRRIGKVGPI